MSRVLIISYYFPPDVGAAVQRVLGLCRHLPKYGWDTSVLAPRHGRLPEGSDVEIPARTPVYRAFTPDPRSGGPLSGYVSSGIKRWIRANLFVPDSRIVWYPFAVKVAREILIRFKCDAIITSGPPHSVHLIGRKMKRELGVPWVMDMRDPWVESYWNAALRRLRPITGWDQRMERKCLREASYVTATHSSLIETLDAAPVVYIPNGYEEADFEKPVHLLAEHMATGRGSALSGGAVFRIVYAGSLSRAYLIMPFLRAIGSLGFCEDLELIFVGPCDPSLRVELETWSKACGTRTFFVGSVRHGQAIWYLRTSSANLFLGIHGDSSGSVNAKVYEYIAARRPIIAVCDPTGVSGTMIRENTGCSCYLQTDEDGIRHVVLEEYTAWKQGKQTDTANWTMPHTRRQMAQEMANVLDDVSRSRNSSVVDTS